MCESDQNYGTKLVNAEQVQIASVLDSKLNADKAIEQVVRGNDVESQQVTVIEQKDSDFNRKLEGDSTALVK
jgi:hypothetical protein